MRWLLAALIPLVPLHPELAHWRAFHAPIRWFALVLQLALTGALAQR
jgi:hypothetical protein